MKIGKILNELFEDENEKLTSLPKPVYYLEESDRSFFMAKGELYCWLYNDTDVEKKMSSGEIQAVFFPPQGPMGAMGGGQDLLSKVWTKGHLKKFKGSEKLLGIIRGFYNEEEKILYIDLMTVNPKVRRQGINSHMIQYLRRELGLTQEQVVFDDPTPQGKKFMAAKKYE